MKLRTVLMIASAALLVTLAVQLIVLFNTQPRLYYMASWKDRPASVEATTELSQNVVHARVVKIRKADPIVTRIQGEPGGVDRIPVEVVTVRLVDDDAKGNKKKGQTIELFHTGHSDAVPPAARRAPRERPPEKPKEGAVEKSQAPKEPDAHKGVLFSAIMNDPAYKVGEEYVLFVREGPTLKVSGREVKTQGIVSPEGRYRVKADKTLVPMSDRAFAKQLRGKPAKQLKEQAAKAAGKGRGPSR